MKKPTTTYVCQQCGATSPKWLGKCPSCGQWNTYNEEIVQTTTRFSGGGVSATGRAAIAKPLPISEIATTEAARIDTNNNEF
ncbi:MAG: DNA repair protein RadA, partial [Bacteroidales bacterium]|nr:DNA repair protein RadA [Bacteroidales bacterium]